MTVPYLSIILPAHNEEMRLPETLKQVEKYLSSCDFESEMIIVENASSDTTLEIASEFALRNRNCIVLSEPIPGKGNAVRTGMLAARGTYRFVCDADLSMSIDQVNAFLPPSCSGYDIAIGSREAPGAQRIDEPAYRHLIGRVFNTMVRWLTLPGLQDTQCGFKCFTATAAEALFPLQTMDGWTFDVEILAIAMKRGYKVVEVPIRWRYFHGSKVHVITDSLHMAMDLITIRRRLRKGEYDFQA
jgi:glycosyltransferase involved in cell wall biosynthesis